MNRHSSWSFCTNAGVPQASVLVTLLFLIFINDLTDGIGQLGIYANDTTVYSNTTVNSKSDWLDEVKLAAYLKNDQ